MQRASLCVTRRDLTRGQSRVQIERKNSAAASGCARRSGELERRAEDLSAVPLFKIANDIRPAIAADVSRRRHEYVDLRRSGAPIRAVERLLLDVLTTDNGGGYAAPPEVTDAPFELLRRRVHS